jgi:hypothetical protein
MTDSINATVFENPVLGKVFTGMEIHEVVQLTRENAMNILKNRISTIYYQQFKVKFKVLFQLNKISFVIDEADQIDYRSSITQLRKLVQ